MLRSNRKGNKHLGFQHRSLFGDSESDHKSGNSSVENLWALERQKIKGALYRNAKNANCGRSEIVHVITQGRIVKIAHVITQ